MTVRRIFLLLVFLQDIYPVAFFILKILSLNLASRSNAMFKSINPYDQKLIAEFPEHDERTIDQKIKTAQKTFQSWRKESFSHRATLMQQAAKLLRANKERYARIISLE